MLFYFTQIEAAYVLFLNPTFAIVLELLGLIMLKLNLLVVLNQLLKRMVLFKIPIEITKKYNLSCGGMLLHYMSNVLFHIYQKMKSTKEILDSLEGNMIMKT